MDRRARFFFLSAIACVILLWPCPPELRWAGITIAVVFAVFGTLSLIDHVSRKRRT